MFERDPNTTCKDCIAWDKLREQSGRRPWLYLSLLVFTLTGMFVSVWAMATNQPVQTTTSILLALGGRIGSVGFAGLSIAFACQLYLASGCFYLGLTSDNYVHLHRHPNIPVAVTHLLVLKFGLWKNARAHGPNLEVWKIRISRSHVLFVSKAGAAISIPIAILASSRSNTGQGVATDILMALSSSQGTTSVLEMINRSVQGKAEAPVAGKIG